MKLPVILTIVILAAGTFWGLRGNRHLTVLREEHRIVRREAAALGVPLDSSKPFVPTKTTRRERPDGALRAKDLADRLAAFAIEIKAVQTSGERPDGAMQNRIMELMDGLLLLDGAELKILIAELKGRQDMDDEMREGMISFSIMMLAQQHPEAALALFTESSDLIGESPMSKHALTASLAQWAKDQPLAALEWIKKNASSHPDLVTDATKAAVIGGAARNNFALALQLIGELDVSPDKSGVMHQIVQAAATPEQRAELLAALRKEAGKATDKAAGETMLSAGLSGLFNQVAQSGHDEAMEWVKTAGLTAAETGKMAEDLSYFRTKGDTGKWLDWMSSQTMDSDKSTNVTRQLVRSWTQQDYRAAGEWLAETPAGPMKETATISYLEAIAPYEPDVAAQWAETLPAAKQKEAFRDIYQALKRKDEPAAKEFAERHGVDVKK